MCIYMMAILGCQLNYIWNELTPKQLGIPVREFSSLNHSRQEDALQTLRWEDPPQTWAAPCAGSLQKGHDRRELLFFCLLVLALSGKFIPSVALAPASSEFQNILKISRDIQPCGRDNYWRLGLCIDSQPLWD